MGWIRLRICRAMTTYNEIYEEAERSLHRWAFGDLQRIHAAEEASRREKGKDLSSNTEDIPTVHVLGLRRKSKDAHFMFLAMGHVSSWSNLGNMHGCPYYLGHVKSLFVLYYG
jgi:hypothetical protein